MSNEHNCPRCNAPFLYFTQINTRVFYCGSDTQIPSMACRYASQLQDRIKRLAQAGDCLLSHRNSTDYHEKVREWDKAKKDKP